MPRERPCALLSDTARVSHVVSGLDYRTAPPNQMQQHRRLPPCARHSFSIKPPPDSFFCNGDSSYWCHLLSFFFRAKWQFCLSECEEYHRRVDKSGTVATLPPFSRFIGRTLRRGDLAKQAVRHTATLGLKYGCRTVAVRHLASSPSGLSCRRD